MFNNHDYENMGKWNTKHHKNTALWNSMNVSTFILSVGHVSLFSCLMVSMLTQVPLSMGWGQWRSTNGGWPGEVCNQSPEQPVECYPEGLPRWG